MKVLSKKINYFAIAAVSLLVIIIFTIGLQYRQVVKNQDKGEIGRIELFVRGIQSPQGLALGKDQKLFTQCAYDGKISIINKDGKAFDYTYLDKYYGFGIEIDKNDNMLMAATDKVIRFDSFGRIIQSFQGFENAYDVELAPDDTIFVSDSYTNEIYKISPQGNITVFATFGGRKSNSVPNVTGIHFDKEFKNLYAVNMYTGNLYKFTLSENYESKEVEIIASDLKNPNLMDIDANGNIYITCLGDNTVVRVDQNSIVEYIDTGGKLATPFGIVFVDSNNKESALYVASRESNSIYKINIWVKNKAKK